MASAVEQLAAVATRRQDAVEEEVRELRGQVVELRLALARAEGASLVWSRLMPLFSVAISGAALGWAVFGG